MRPLFLFVLLYLLPGRCAAAITDTSGLIHFNIKGGFPSNNVYSVIQDRNNYLWFATDHGVVKYNGYNIEIYNTANGNLPSDDIYELYEDNRGRLWLKSFSEEFGYIKNGAFKSINYGPEKRMIRPQYFCEVGGILYFIERWTDHYNILFVDDHLIKQITLPLYLDISSQRLPINHMSVSENFTITFWMENSSLYRWDSKSKDKMVYIGKYPEVIKNSFARGMYISPKNKAYKANMDADEINYFDIDKNFFKIFSVSKSGGDKGEKLYTYNADFYPGNYSKNTAVFSNTHIYTLDTNFNFQNRIKFDDVIPSIKQIAYRLTDRINQMWYTTKGDGAWFKPSFYNFYVSRKVVPQLQDCRYLGKIGNSSFWWDKTKLEMYEYAGEIYTLKFKKGIELRSISGNDSIAFICTSECIYRFDRKTKQLTNITGKYIIKEGNSRFTNKSGISSYLHEGRNIAMVGDTAYFLSGDGYLYISFHKDTAVITKDEFERYLDIYYDKTGGKLYLYSNHKILVRDLVKNTNKNIRTDFIKRDSVNNIRQLLKDTYGNIFILGDNDLFVYNEQKERLKKISLNFSVSNSILRIHGRELVIAGAFGIATAMIKGIDKVGAFSVLPNIGANQYNRVENFVLDDNGHGILQSDMNSFSFSLDSLRKYALRGNNGFFSLVLLRPSEKLLSNNDTFRYDQAETQIKLDAVNGFGKGNVKYLYRINGKGQWQESGAGEIFLGTLAPARYSKIECIVTDEVWKSNTYAFYIYRQPFWWQTSTWKTMFWIGGILVVIGLILMTILITRYFSARKEEKKRALTELELRAIHAQINPHFIFNTLSTALFFIKKNRLDDAFVHVSKFSKLLRAYLKASQNRYISLGEEIEMLRNYMELQQIRFDKKFTYSIDIDNKLPVNNIMIPSLLLQPLVENAINHGLFHSSGAGELLLRFKQGKDNNEMICEIEDNGIGREASKKINEMSSTKESYGTKLTNKLLDIFKDYEHMDITLEYTDKPYPEPGTLVKLTLKNLRYVT